MTTKELLLLLMSMRNKLYMIQFSHHSVIDTQQVPKQWSWNLELADFANFAELLNKTEVL